MIKLTEDDFTTFDLDGEEYYQWSGSKEKMKQILENTVKAYDYSRVEAKYLELLLENKLLKEEQKTAFQEYQLWRDECDRLKQKLEKIKEFQDDLECGNNHSDEYPEFIKELLDSQEKQ